jgi:hypothetical protein
LAFENLDFSETDVAFWGIPAYTALEFKEFLDGVA